MARQKLIGEATPDQVYTVPTKGSYKTNRANKTMSWENVYGNKKCFVCRQPMAEGDRYVASLQIKHKRSTLVVRHEDCDPLNPPKRSRKQKAIDDLEDQIIDNTKTIYMDNRPAIGSIVDIDDFGWTVIEHGEDEEGMYIIIDKLSEDEDE
jgi:hypothetical protein